MKDRIGNRGRKEGVRKERKTGLEEERKKKEIKEERKIEGNRKEDE